MTPIMWTVLTLLLLLHIAEMVFIIILVKAIQNHREVLYNYKMVSYGTLSKLQQKEVFTQEDSMNVLREADLVGKRWAAMGGS